MLTADCYRNQWGWLRSVLFHVMPNCTRSARKVKRQEVMTTDDFISALNIAVERGDLTSNQKSDISENLSGYEGIDFVLRDQSGKVVAKINQGLVIGKLEREGKVVSNNPYSNERGAVKWANSMGYPVPSKWNGCLSTFLVIIGLCAYVIPGVILLLIVWNNGRQYERDMKSLIEKWIDAGKPEPGVKARDVELLEKIEEKPTESPSTESRLEELQSMKEKGLISQEEYDTLRKKALGL